MILTKLKEYAENRMDLPPTMYAAKAVRWLVDIDLDGNLIDFISLEGDTKNTKYGKKIVTPQVPPKGSGIKPKLLADTGEYVFGIPKTKPKQSDPIRVEKYHQSFKKLTELCAIETKVATVEAVWKFIQNWNPKSDASKLPEEFDPSHTVTFRVDNVIPADAKASLRKVEDFWEKYAVVGIQEAKDKKSVNEPVPIMMCLIEGERLPVMQRLPVPIKGIPGNRPEVALVSANSSAFMSYGLQNSLTSPISKDAAEKFANALNSLIADERSRIYLGSTVYVFWTKEPTDLNLPPYFKQPDPQAVANLLKSPHNAKRASSLEANKFYGLSLTANNARAVVRDWLETTVPNVEENLKAWFQKQQIVDAFGAEYRPLSVYVLAASIYRDAAKEMQPSVPTALMRNALKGDRLPYDLLNKLVRRNRVERNVTYPRAMLTKLIFSDSKTKPMMINMEQLNLNPNLEGGDRAAYHCGRLLAVLEAIQRKAIGSVNASLTDRYYGAASSTPANAFTPLMKGARSHLAKLRKQTPGTCNALEVSLEEILVNIPATDYPKTLNLQQQGLFALGYYHQRASDRAASEAYKKKHQST